MREAAARKALADEDYNRPARRSLRLVDPDEEPRAERRTIVITGQPTPAPRRQSAAERHIAARPDRVALWAFLLGLFMVFMAAATAYV